VFEGASKGGVVHPEKYTSAVMVSFCVTLIALAGGTATPFLATALSETVGAAQPVVDAMNQVVIMDNRMNGIWCFSGR
jgi:hypothetical protein